MLTRLDDIQFLAQLISYNGCQLELDSRVLIFVSFESKGPFIF